MRRKMAVILFGCLLVAVVFTAAGCAESKPGVTAPDFELQDLKGQAVSLGDYRGHPVVLNFWASWCGSCRYGLPFFQEVYADTEWQAAGLVILAVNLGESPAAVAAFVEASGFTFPVLLDVAGEAAAIYNVRSIPATFFIDERGIIRYSKVGAFSSKAVLEQTLRDLFE